MKHHLKLLLIFAFCYSNLKAIDIYKEGYILSLKGDTTKGFLLVQIAPNASEKCIFKQTVDGNPSTFLPGEIAGYRYVNGKYYISKEIKVDSATKKVVFLEFLIKGTASVYYYVDNEMEHYYIEKSPGGFTELTEKEKTYLDEDGRTYISPSQYKGKLAYILQDCPSIRNEIQNTKLSHKSLIKLTKDYHKKVCSSESCIIYERGNTSAIVQFGILAGISQNKYNFDNFLISNFRNCFQIGAGVKISNFLFFNEHINLKANFLFEKDSKSYTLYVQDLHKIYYMLVQNGNSSYLGNYKNGFQTDLSITDLKIPISFNYNFNLTQKSIYTLGIGISNKIILTQNTDYQIKSPSNAFTVEVSKLLGGVIVTTGIEGNWLGKHTAFVNGIYEYLYSYNQDLNRAFQTYNTQFTIQAGVYF